MMMGGMMMGSMMMGEEPISFTTTIYVHVEGPQAVTTDMVQSIVDDEAFGISVDTIQSISLQLD